ncbi:MAG: SDR family oxidoreductase [Clostridiales bacterium]|nr:SDR family oxidoreductase [Clostridiales bacterium]
MQNKTVLITGATRGIGRATALLFAERGWNVAFTYQKNTELANSLEAELVLLGVKAFGVACDQKNSSDCTGFVDRAVKEFGGIDAVVNNAGIAQSKMVMDMSDADWDNMFSVNMDGVFYISRAAIPYLINKNSAIVNVSSMWGRAGASCEAHYSAAKSAVIGFTRALAKELGPSGVRVNCVAPGVITTDMNAHLSEDDIKELEEETPLCRVGNPEEVAKAIYFLASDEASFITGQTLGVDGGFVID